MKILKRVAIAIIAVIIAITLFISLVVIVNSKLHPDEVPSFFGYKPFIVLSGSMESLISKGDLVLVKVVDTDKLKENDIIAFRNEKDTVTTHRIVEITEENGETYFKTKGDSNNAEDANLVNENDVEGIYLFKIAGLGSVLMKLKEPKVLGIILVVIFVIGIIWLKVTDKIEENQMSEEEKREFEEYKKAKGIRENINSDNSNSNNNNNKKSKNENKSNNNNKRKTTNSKH